MSGELIGCSMSTSARELDKDLKVTHFFTHSKLISFSFMNYIKLCSEERKG